MRHTDLLMSYQLIPKQPFQYLFQLGSAPVNAAANRTHWNLHQHSNFFVLQIFHFLQNQHFTIFWRQFAESDLDQFLTFCAFDSKRRRCFRV